MEHCLRSLKRQTYKNIEYVISDGLSTDNTLKIAHRYKSRIVKNTKILAEPGLSLGFKNAKGDILIVIAVDNEFKEHTAIATIVDVFKDKNIYAAFPKHDSSREDNFFTQYTNTFTDPFNHFVYGYGANARTFKKIYKTVKHTNDYDIYDFKSKRIYQLLHWLRDFQ